MKNGGTFSIIFFRVIGVVIFCFFSFSNFIDVHQALAYTDIAAIFLDEEEDPITTSLDLRVSLWDDYFVRPGDIEVDGSINPSALHYAEYETTFTATPNQYGFYKFEMELLPAFPALSPFNSYLQLEYKSQGADDTDYLIYDYLDDPPFQNVTRLLLDENTVYYVTEAGPRTSWNTFTLDANNNAATAVVLQFGETLAKTLSFTLSTDRFDLSDDLNINGTLTATGMSSTGTINFSAANVGIGTATPASAFQVADGYYAQFSDQNSGAPPAGDCDSDAEFGRISSDVTNHRLYICQGQARGWDYASLTD